MIPPKIKNLCSNIINQQTVELTWEIQSDQPVANSFQLQIAADSTFKWLLHGSIDGHGSRYRKFSSNMEDYNFIPEPLLSAIETGELEQLTGKDAKPHLDILNALSRDVLITMQHDSIDFETCLARIISNVPELEVLKELYETALTPAISASYLEQYLELTGLPRNLLQATSFKTQIKVHVDLDAFQKVFWRVRLKEGDSVLSRWSDTSEISSKVL